MTRRITLTLGESTAAEKCGDCPHAFDQRGWFCDAFDGVRLFANRGESPIRREHAAERMDRQRDRPAARWP